MQSTNTPQRFYGPNVSNAAQPKQKKASAPQVSAPAPPVLSSVLTPASSTSARKRRNESSRPMTSRG